jgi:rubrerythrin
MPATGIVSRGIARKKRSDAAIARKSGMDTFADLFRRMSPSEQATVLEVLRQIRRSSDSGIARKSGMDTFADLFRRMSSSEQATVLEVLRQIQRLGLPAAQGQEEPSGDNNV